MDIGLVIFLLSFSTLFFFWVGNFITFLYFFHPSVSWSYVLLHHFDLTNGSCLFFYKSLVSERIIFNSVKFMENSTEFATVAKKKFLTVQDEIQNIRKKSYDVKKTSLVFGARKQEILWIYLMHIRWFILWWVCKIELVPVKEHKGFSFDNCNWVNSPLIYSVSCGYNCGYMEFTGLSGRSFIIGKTSITTFCPALLVLITWCPFAPECFVRAWSFLEIVLSFSEGDGFLLNPSIQRGKWKQDFFVFPRCMVLRIRGTFLNGSYKMTSLIYC